MEIYDEIFNICIEHGIDFFSTLPCSHNIKLIQKLEESNGKILNKDAKPVIHVPLVREEAGVSLSAGAFIGGRKTAMIIQNQGLGNMVTLLLSLNCNLTGSYNIPNILIISHRGIGGETINAQKPLGIKSKEILDLIGFKHCSVKEPSDLKEFRELFKEYDKGNSIAVLVEPGYDTPPFRIKSKEKVTKNFEKIIIPAKKIESVMSRRQAISTIMDQIDEEFVLANLGHPSRELHHIKDRDKNFYLTSCLGHSYTLGLGLALSIADLNKKIICFEGDGGLSMNPGSLAILTDKLPNNLVFILLDNGVWGSTGNTETYTSKGLNLSAIVQAYGFPESKIKYVSKEGELVQALSYALNNEGPFLIHIITTDQFEKVPILPISIGEIKERFMNSIKKERNNI